ncbi:hypothetical protein GQ42DRAFT_164234 [Ramicandelaber brevisporus]|nr:hypothetical protein GQ42DRAFT_164234 [Ramicandelaber brevisporus]
MRRGTTLGAGTVQVAPFTPIRSNVGGFAVASTPGRFGTPGGQLTPSRLARPLNATYGFPGAPTPSTIRKQQRMTTLSAYQDANQWNDDALADTMPDHGGYHARLPVPDFNFDELCERMEALKGAFMAHSAARGRDYAMIRAEFTKKHASDKDRLATSAAEIEQYKKQIEEHNRTAELEHKAESELMATVEEQRNIVSALEHDRNTLQETVNNLRKEVERKKAAEAAKHAIRLKQEALHETELACFEQKLGLKIWNGVPAPNGLKGDFLGFIFENISEDNPSQRHSILVNVSADDATKAGYDVAKCDPMLPDIADHLEWLRKSRDFFGFLKRVRGSFVQLARNKQQKARR